MGVRAWSVALVFGVLGLDGVRAAEPLEGPKALVLLSRVHVAPDGAEPSSLAELLVAADAAVDAAIAAHEEAFATWQATVAADPVATPPPEPKLAFPEARRLCEEAVRRFGRAPGVDAAHYLLGWIAAEELRDAAAIRTFEALAKRWPASRYAVEARLRAADLHFQFDRLAKALRGFEAVVAAGDTPLAAVGLYKLAWTLVRLDRGAEAIDRFDQIVLRADAAAADPRAQQLRADAIAYLAILSVEADLDGDERPDRDAGWTRIMRWLGRGAPPHHAEVVAQILEHLTAQGDVALAERVRERLRALDVPAP